MKNEITVSGQYINKKESSVYPILLEREIL